MGQWGEVRRGVERARPQAELYVGGGLKGDNGGNKRYRKFLWFDVYNC